jgi:hypothetical protein
VVGCPTVCRHCWAQGVPYPAMPLADVAWVLEQSHRSCDHRGLGFGAYPMHELAAHPQVAELLGLFADHVGTAEFEPLSTTGVPLAVLHGLTGQWTHFSRACPADGASRSASVVAVEPSV